MQQNHYPTEDPDWECQACGHEGDGEIEECPWCHCQTVRIVFHPFTEEDRADGWADVADLYLED